ncbi:MAG: radical SAM protein [Candidatus Diapherotrites archaeon]
MKDRMEFYRKLRILKFPMRCNNNCIICDDFGEPDNQPREFGWYKEEIDYLASKNKHIFLYGGEPFLDPNIFKILEYLAKTDVTFMISTNCRPLSQKSLAKKLRGLRLTMVVTTLFSHKENTHDFLTGTPGSHSETVAGIRNLLDEKIPVTVNIVLTSKNLGDLLGTVDFLSTLGVKNIKISGLVKLGKMDRRQDLVPDFESTRKEIGKALQFAEGKDLSLVFEKLPACAAKKDSNFFYEPHHKKRMMMCPSGTEKCNGCGMAEKCMCFDLEKEQGNAGHAQAKPA